MYDPSEVLICYSGHEFTVRKAKLYTNNSIDGMRKTILCCPECDSRDLRIKGYPYIVEYGKTVAYPEVIPFHCLVCKCFFMATESECSVTIDIQEDGKPCKRVATHLCPTQNCGEICHTEFSRKIIEEGSK